MPVQKYPYKVTKLDWYDYISKGEFNIPFRVSVKSPITTQTFGFNTTVGVMLINKETEEVYAIRDSDVLLQEAPEAYNGTSIVTFKMPYYAPIGSYFVVIKYSQRMLTGRTAINTIPTDTKELQVTVLDGFGCPEDIDPTKPIPKEKLEMNFDREVTDENN